MCASSGIKSQPVHDRVENLRRIATALAQDATVEDMARTVTRECHIALAADATCTFLLRDDGQFHLMSHLNCTNQFVCQWSSIPPSALPLVSDPHPETALFIGTAREFKKAVANVDELVDNSGRAIVGYAPLVVDQKVTGVLGFSYNSGHSPEMDREFVLLLVNLCGMALERARLSEREKSASRAKSDFLGTVSHEIRTPLGLIHGYTELLLQSNLLNSEQRRWAQIVHRNTEQLICLVGDVLDMHKIESQNFELSRDVIRSDALLDDVIQTARLRAAEKGLRMNLEKGDVPPEFLGDGMRIRQILLNLIGNAIKFTGAGHVTLRSATDAQGMLVFDIADTGIGIAPDLREVIFGRYSQAESTISRRFGGTGLGLYISRLWARAMGGDVTLISSEPGMGSTFRLELPIQRPVEQTTVPRPHAGETVSCPIGKVLSGLKILVAEDSPDNQELIGILLRQRGADVSVVGCGTEAVNAAHAGEFDVILMDLQMPGMDGVEACRRLRNGGYMGSIAALTAHALKSERDRALADGFNAYLTKPIEIQRLVTTIKALAARGH